MVLYVVVVSFEVSKVVVVDFDVDVARDSIVVVEVLNLVVVNVDVL
tara:strand:- start:1628 stop:1765 length:138 start_codon:yes stop_codon:yes gene_type:complete